MPAICPAASEKIIRTQSVLGYHPGPWIRTLSSNYRMAVRGIDNTFGIALMTGLFVMFPYSL